MWLGLLGLHLIGLSGYNLMLRRAVTEELDRWTLATIMQIAITLPMVVAVFLHPLHIHTYNPTISGLVLADIVLVIGLHWTNVKSLQYLEASVYSVLYNLRILFTTLLGLVFLHEKTLLLEVLGGVLIFLAILLVRQKGRRELTRRGIEWGIMASLIISFLNLTDKTLLNRINYLDYSIPASFLTVAIMLGILFYRGQKLPLATMKQPRILALMFFRAISAYGFTLAFYYGAQLGVSSYISSLSVIIIVFLGVVWLKERDYLRQKVTAAALAVIGLTCILIGSFLK